MLRLSEGRRYAVHISRHYILLVLQQVLVLPEAYELLVVVSLLKGNNYAVIKVCKLVIEVCM